MTLYARTKAPKGGEILFAPLAASVTSGLNLTETGGSYHFDPVSASVTPPPPPPPPDGFFLPIPAGWQSVMQTDFTKVTALPSADWAYGGRPGGTSGCLWEASQLSFGPNGAAITTQWSASLSSWISAGIGTHASYAFPLRVRWYDMLADANIEGKNKVNLLWCNPWVEEIDVDECSVSGGAWTPTISRIHNGSSANVTSPIVQTVAQPVGSVHCHECELAVVNGVPTYTIFVDGVQSGSAVIPASDWATMLANPHWVGTQDELYSVGTASQSAVSVRYVAGVEVLQPA